MSNIIKIFKLNTLIIKPYIKSIVYITIIPILLVISSKSLTSAIIATMTLLALRGTSLIFQIEEKENIVKFYNLIPVKKSQLVIGRYIFIIILGLSTLIASLLIQSIILINMGVNIIIIDSFILGITVYFLSISLQVPGFYKFGSINGSIFVYIPIIIFFIINYLIGSLDIIGLNPILYILDNQNLIYIILLIFSIISLGISLIISMKIFEKK